MARPLLIDNQQSWNWRWAGIFLLVSTLLGLSLLAVPAWITIVGIIAIATLVYLSLNPDKVFYLLIFTIPFTDRVRVLPISFSLNDMVVLFCTILCLVHMLIRRQRISFRTKLDPWIAVLTVTFFLAGIFSENSTGILDFFKVFESFIVYYMCVYFIRTKQITRSQIIKVMLFTVLSQAALGIFQSLTGIGSDFSSERGYLGYIGLGSSHVWHGRGTTWHFNTLGNFLAVSFFIFLPFYLYAVKRKKWATLLGGVILLGIITTYSRGSLLGLGAGALFLAAITQPTLKRSLMFVGALALLGIFPLVWTFSHSDYVNTVSYEERLIIWQVPIAAITSSTKAFWLGSGLNSYEVVAWPFIPAWVHPDQFRNWFAHNFYLLTILEMGVIGAAILFGFLGWIWIDTWKRFKSTHGFASMYSLGVSAAVFTIFFVSIFDHTFGAPHFKIFLFILLGLLYVNRKPLTGKFQRQY